MTDFLDGPRFVEWLTAVCDLRALSDNRRRSLRHYRSGTSVSLNAADRLGTELGFHLSAIPDDLWLDERPLRRFSPSERREALQRVERGESHREAAEAIGCDRTTIRYWLGRDLPDADERQEAA